MIRSANATESATVEPPKPRFVTGRPGNASAVCQNLMVELPVGYELVLVSLVGVEGIEPSTSTV